MNFPLIEIVCLVLVIGFIFLIWLTISEGFLRCPDCNGKLMDWDLHNCNPLNPIYKCVKCKKEWM